MRAGRRSPPRRPSPQRPGDRAPEQLERIRAREHAPAALAAPGPDDEVREREQQQRDGDEGGQEEGERRPPSCLAGSRRVAGIVQQLEGSLELAAERGEVDVRPSACELRERRNARPRRDAGHERDLGLLGLLGVEPLLRIREQELDELLGRVLVLRSLEQPARRSRTSTSPATTPGRSSASPARACSTGAEHDGHRRAIRRVPARRRAAALLHRGGRGGRDPARRGGRAEAGRSVARGARRPGRTSTSPRSAASWRRRSSC